MSTQQAEVTNGKAKKSYQGVKESLLSAALEKLQADGLIPHDPRVTSMTRKQKIAAMEHYTAKLPPAEIGTCDACGLDSSAVRFEACPYCGVGDPKDAGGTASAIVPAAAEQVHHGEVVDHDTGRPVKGDVAELDRRVIKIKQLFLGSMNAQWAVAGELADIEQQQLWKHRRTTDGKVAYKTIENFVQQELGITRRYMRQLLEIRTRYTEQDVTAFGTSKLMFLMQMKPEAAKEELEKARGSGQMPPRRELAERHRAGSDDRKRPQKLNPAPREDGKVTVALVEGRTTVPLYKGEGVSKKITSEAMAKAELAPAKQVGDEPWGVWDLANDQRMFFTLTRSNTNQLRLVIKVQRIDPPSGK